MLSESRKSKFVKVSPELYKLVTLNFAYRKKYNMNTQKDIRLDLIRTGDSYAAKIAEAYATAEFGNLYSEYNTCIVSDSTFDDLVKSFSDFTVRDDSYHKETKTKSMVFEGDKLFITLEKRRSELTYTFYTFADVVKRPDLTNVREHIIDTAKGNNNFYRIRARDYGNPSISACHAPQTTSLDLYPDIDYDSIVKAVTGSKPGFILFQGPPGVGKSRLIEHIIANNPKTQFISMADPKLLRGSLEDLGYFINGNVLVIEEGDDFIKDRKDNPAFMPELLEMTDGHLANELQIKFLITTNLTDEELDLAVKRKNRMLFSQKFRELSKSEVKSLNKAGVCNVPEKLITDKMTLADIFGDDDNGIVAKSKASMGFR